MHKHYKLRMLFVGIKTNSKSNKKTVPEEAAGVGIITKQNSTVDVNKSTPRKNLKAFKLV